MAKSKKQFSSRDRRQLKRMGMLGNCRVCHRLATESFDTAEFGPVSLCLSCANDARKNGLYFKRDA